MTQTLEQLLRNLSSGLRLPSIGSYGSCPELFEPVSLYSSDTPMHTQIYLRLRLLKVFFSHDSFSPKKNLHVLGGYRYLK